MSAKDDNAARLTPIIGAFPKIVHSAAHRHPRAWPRCSCCPGSARPAGPDLQRRHPRADGQVPADRVCSASPITGLLAAFMAGMAANVSAFNAVFTYDIWQDYIRPAGPTTTTCGSAAGPPSPGSASASAPRSSPPASATSPTTSRRCSRSSTCRCSPRSSSACSGSGGHESGFWGILVGTITSSGIYILYQVGVIRSAATSARHVGRRSSRSSLGVVAMVIATRFSEPKTDEELQGLVYGRETLDRRRHRRATASPRSSRARSRSARCPWSCASSRTPTSSS